MTYSIIDLADKEKQQYSTAEVLQKLRSYCAYQERCSTEVLAKAKSYNRSEEELEELLVLLKEENYLNDDRFLESFINSKINQKRWGYFKIKAALQQRSFYAREIDTALKKIEESRFVDNLEVLIDQKIRRTKDPQKLIFYLKSKGYASDMIISSLRARNLM